MTAYLAGVASVVVVLVVVSWTEKLHGWPEGHLFRRFERRVRRLRRRTLRTK